MPRAQAWPSFKRSLKLGLGPRHVLSAGPGPQAGGLLAQLIVPPGPWPGPWGFAPLAKALVNPARILFRWAVQFSFAENSPARGYFSSKINWAVQANPAKKGPEAPLFAVFSWPVMPS